MLNVFAVIALIIAAAQGYSRGWYKEGWMGFVVFWLWFGLLFSLMAIPYGVVALLLSG